MHLATGHKNEATMPNRMGGMSKEFKIHELWLRVGKKIFKYEHNKTLNNVTSYYKLCLIYINNFSFKTISALDFNYTKHLYSVGTRSYYNHNTSNNIPKGSTKLLHQPTQVVMPNIQIMSSD